MNKPVRRPATTQRQREMQVISMAYDLAEKQIREGTASAQVITHFLKLATAREELERDNLAARRKLLEAQVNQIESSQKMEELYAKAIRAMTEYAGEVDDHDD